MPMDLAESELLAWLDTAVNHELRGDFAAIKLERIRAFLRFLPPLPAPCTVAGTKGKGSTVRLIEAALIANGQSTVAFTSPHVVSVCERWRVDGRDADSRELLDVAQQVAALECAHDIALTWFERTFAMACLLVAKRPGTHFLIEVGLGGRLDCANVLDAAVAVLTHLSHDHRDVLGPTLTHIAREKCAIARTDRPLVIAPQTPQARQAICDVLEEMIDVQPLVQWVEPSTARIPLRLLGAHQQANAATALAAALALFPELDGALAQQAMGEVVLPARCQMVEFAGRRVLIDGAHNGPSIAATLAVAADQLRPGWQIVIGVAKDKELDEIVAAIPFPIPVTRCGYASPRARRRDDWPTTTWPWAERITDALAMIPADVDVCVTGSFYLAGEALQLMRS